MSVHREMRNGLGHHLWVDAGVIPNERKGVLLILELLYTVNRILGEVLGRMRFVQSDDNSVQRT